MSVSSKKIPLKPIYYSSCLSINRLRLSVKIGHQPGERIKAQPLEVEIRFYFPTLPAACFDDDGDFICYDEVCQAVQNLTKEKEFRLIEYLAMELHKTIRRNITKQGITRSDAIKIWLRLHKCVPPVPYMLDGASFTYTDLPQHAVLAPQ